MAISTDVVARTYFNVVAATPIAVDYPLYAKTDLFVYYGNAGVLATLNVDYTVTLNGDFSTFVVTPLAALITKINTAIVADPTEQNVIVARRIVDYLTSSTPAAVRDTSFTSREFDYTVMRLQQLSSLMTRAITYADNIELDAPRLTLIPTGKALIISGDGTQIIAGPDATDIAAAAPSAAAAVAAAAVAVPAASTASAAAVAAAASAAAAQVAEMIWRGAWVASGHGYFVNDVVRNPGGGSYICVTAHTSGASFATDLGAGKWQLVAADGTAGAGTGDMIKSTYDPTSKNADAFAMANMVEGSTQKILTATERTKLAGIATGATVANQASVGAAIATSNKTAVVNADVFAILDSASSFLLKYVTGTAMLVWLKAYFDTLYQGITASVAWSRITGTPNTLAGYGITDGAASSDVVLLASGNLAVAAASININLSSFTSVYRGFRCVFYDTGPTSNGASPLFRVSSDGGSTFYSGAADYKWIVEGNQILASGAMFSISNADYSDSCIHVTQNSDPGLQTSDKCACEFEWYTVASDPMFLTKFWGDLVKSSNNSILRLNGMAQYKNGALAVNGMQFSYSSGNVAAGTKYAIYGMK